MTVETRYFRSDTHTVNTLTYKILGTSKSGTAGMEYVTWQTTTVPAQAWVRIVVYKVASGGTQTQIAVGAVATIAGNTTAVVSATINIPQTALQPTDAILVEVQYSTDGTTFAGLSSVLLGADWITEQLGTTILNAATWTVYYDLSFSSTYNPSTRRYTNELDFRYDGTYASRIENFTWGVVAVAKIAYSDGLVCVLTAMLRRLPSKPLPKCFPNLSSPSKCFGCRLQPRLRL